MNNKYNSQGFLENPCVQMNTSITSITNDQLDISSSLEPQYMEESDKAVHIFRDNDYLSYRKFDPKAYHEWKSKQADNSTQRNADKLNPVVNQ